MNRKTVDVFHALMKNGWIDRREDPVIWGYSEDFEVMEELETFKVGMNFDLYRFGDRLYLIPTQDNDLFLKNNIDYRRDIKADNNIRTRDLYLLNYFAIYTLYLFFNGEGANPLSREFITKEDLVAKFSEHCRSIEKDTLDDDDKQTDYSDNFRQLASCFLGKIDGEQDTMKFDCKFGVLNKLLIKFKTDMLFETNESNQIRPTRKLKDLMPYFLRKDRISEIQSWVEEADRNAANQ